MSDKHEIVIPKTLQLQTPVLCKTGMAVTDNIYLHISPTPILIINQHMPMIPFKG